MPPTPLPMAIAGCDLDEARLHDQAERYRRLGALASEVQLSGLQLTVSFTRDPDPALVRTTVEVERQCCSFFTLDYDETRRRLMISVADPARAEALDAVHRAVSAGRR